MLTKDNLKSMLEALKKVRSDEALVGNQHKIDANKDGKITGDDFKKLKGKKEDFTYKSQNQMDREKEAEKSLDKTIKKVAKKDPERAKELSKLKKESVEQFEAELQDNVNKTIDRVAHNVNNMREALKKVWEASLLPQKGGETPDATMKHVKKSDHKGEQDVDNWDKQVAERSKGEAEFVKKHVVDVIDGEKIELDSIDKSKTATKPAPGRKNDQKTGDKAIINKPEDITAKGLGGKDLKGFGSN